MKQRMFSIMYIEQITPTSNSFRVDLNVSAINAIKQQPLKLSTFFNEKSWRRYGAGVMYPHSWALIFFLFTTEEGNDYQQVSCEETIELDAGELLGEYYGGIDKLEKDFYSWLNSTKRSQYYY